MVRDRKLAPHYPAEYALWHNIPGWICRVAWLLLTVSKVMFLVRHSPQPAASQFFPFQFEEIQHGRGQCDQDD
jgi:hypothetical protein